MLFLIHVAKTNTQRQEHGLEHLKCLVFLLKDWHLLKLEYHDLAWKSRILNDAFHYLYQLLWHKLEHCTLLFNTVDTLLSSGSRIPEIKEFFSTKEMNVTRGYQQVSRCCHSCRRPPVTSILNKLSGGFICINSLAPVDDATGSLGQVWSVKHDCSRSSRTPLPV